MLDRCYNKNNKDFPNYGKRGIKVTPKWHDFSEFLKDMGPCPDLLELDRKDWEKGYDKSNCHWATEQTQAENRSTTRWTIVDGNKVTMKEAAKRLGLKYNTLKQLTHAKGKYRLSTEAAIARLMQSKRS